MPTTITKLQHHTTSRLFRVSEIRPNPFRDSERYPFQPDKIKALRESIRTTGYWDNVLARIGEDGKPEIAYGHHRIEAFRQEVGPNAEITLPVRELDDAMMLRMLVRDNKKEWSTNALGNQANVRAVVNAYADGKVQLSPPNSKAPRAKVRFAPSFRQGYVPGRKREHPYTVVSVTRFLGEGDRTKVESVLAALELVERGLVAENLYKGLTLAQADFLTTEVRRVVHGHDVQVKRFEKQAAMLRKGLASAGKPKSKKERQERDVVEKLVGKNEREAAAARKRGKEQAEYVAYWVSQTSDSVERRMANHLAKLTELPPPPRHERNSEDEIERYLYWLSGNFESIHRFQEQVERFSPEQIDKALRGSHALREALAAFETALKQVVHERQERGGAAPVAPTSQRKNKGKVAEAVTT